MDHIPPPPRPPAPCCSARCVASLASQISAASRASNARNMAPASLGRAPTSALTGRCSRTLADGLSLPHGVLA
eukprot:3194593-Lingulodinium_polyedra.AAC.1